MMHALRSTIADAPRRVSALGVVAVSLPVVVQLVVVVRHYMNWTPVWSWYADPGYQYLLGGGSLITGGDSRLVEHPGMSIQWLIGISEYATYVVAGQGGFREDIIARPEYYAQTSGAVLAALFIASLGFAAWRFLRFLGAAPALFFQLILLWGMAMLIIGRYRLMPESLVLTAAVTALAIAAPALSRARPALKTRELVALGLVCAVGLTAKILFLPIVAVMLVLIGHRQRLVFLVSFVVPIVAIMIPTYTRLNYMVGWYLGIATQPGRQGQTGDWSPLSHIRTSMELVGGFVRWFALVAGLIVVLSVVLMIVQLRRSNSQALRPTAAILFGLAFVLLAAFKPAEVRDFLLTIPLLAALGAIGLHDALSLVTLRIRYALGAVSIALATLMAAHGTVHSEYLSAGNRAYIEDVIDDASAVEAFISDGRWALGYNVWTLDNALMYAGDWTPGSFGPELQERAPDALYFELWGRTINQVADDGSFRALTCANLQQILANDGLGIVVESPGHLDMDTSGSRIVLKEATAGFDAPMQVGRFEAYRLTDVTCVL